MEYQVTHFRFLDTIRDFPTPPAEYVRNVQPAGHLPTGAGTEDRRGHQPSGRHTLRRQIHLLPRPALPRVGTTEKSIIST